MDHASAARDQPWICPFLHASAGGSLTDPIGWPDETNRCTALGDAAPQSLRQQEYACLASAHVNCPRYARGVHLVAEAPPPAAAAGLRLTPAVAAALLVLAASFALSIGFVVANGGMNLPAVATGSPEAGVPSMSAGPSGASEGSVAPTDQPTPEPSATASVDAATATPTVVPTAAPTLAPTTAPTSAPTARPSSDRYALLEPCPDAPDCWIYRIREGDNLVSIARYFGVPFATVTEMNPWTETTQLVAGQELRLPPPTR